ncbi:hypothetical protein QU577_27625 [Priestia megaterium]|uniref:hypothetical protein n=1 Tax=Priestia megaterium TaxID=1404 RepID=UPI0025B05269|nr:hypothetical protein [Priestia megaterium]MDN3365516.1 hypothetical protein [Priestia megaterium]
MKTKKNGLVFVGVTVVLLIIVVILAVMPSVNSDKKEPTSNESISNDTQKQTPSTKEEKTTVTSSSNNANAEMEQAISKFLEVWYTKKDRNEIENLIGKNMTKQLRDKYFGTETIPTPANEGGGEGDVVEYSKSLDSLDVYVKQNGDSFDSMYEAETSMTIGNNKSSQEIIGKVEVVNENGKWLVNNFEELDVKAK